jgi:hypothetical protein
MPIQKLMNKLWQFTWDRNQDYNAPRVELRNLHAVSRHYGFSKQESGYAISTLEKMNKLKYYPKSGWCALR